MNAIRFCNVSIIRHIIPILSHRHIMRPTPFIDVRLFFGKSMFIAWPQVARSKRFFVGARLNLRFYPFERESVNAAKLFLVNCCMTFKSGAGEAFRKVTYYRAIRLCSMI